MILPTLTLLFLCRGAGALPSTDDNRLSQLETNLSLLEQREKVQETKVAQILSSILGQISKHDSEISKLKDEIAALTSSRNSCDSEILRLKNDLRDVQRSVEQGKQEVNATREILTRQEHAWQRQFESELATLENTFNTSVKDLKSNTEALNSVLESQLMSLKSNTSLLSSKLENSTKLLNQINVTVQDIPTLKFDLQSTKTNQQALNVKVTNIEHETGQLRRNISTVINSIRTVIGEQVTIDSELFHMKHTVTGMNDSLTKAIHLNADTSQLLLGAHQQLNDKVRGLKSHINDMEANMTSIHASLDRVQAITYLQVAFTARGRATFPKFSRPVALTDVVVNEGRGYTPSTGEFHAPVSGIYFFWVDVTCPGLTSGQNYTLTLHTGTTILGNHMPLVSVTSFPTSLHTMANVRQGQRVWFSLDGTPSGSTGLVLDASFDGVLLHSNA